MSWYKFVDFDELEGKTFDKVTVDYDYIAFKSTDGDSYILKHLQDCCEHVYIESIDGDIEKDLPGQKILQAYKAVSSDDPPDKAYYESYTWTFFVIRTNLDTFTIRFFGSSNGYYSEDADLFIV